MLTVPEYRARAELMRKMAQGAGTEMLRQAYFSLALNWEELADRVEGGQSRKPASGCAPEGP
jgi:hypothetical protein